MGNLKKKRRLKMNKHKRRKRLKANRHKKRTWQKWTAPRARSALVLSLLSARRLSRRAFCRPRAWCCHLLIDEDGRRFPDGRAGGGRTGQI